MAASILRLFRAHLLQAAKVPIQAPHRLQRFEHLSSSVRIPTSQISNSADLQENNEHQPHPRGTLFRDLCSVGTVEGILDKVGQQELSGNEASIAVSALRHVHKKESTEKFVADGRFKKLSSSITNGVKNLSNESLTSTLTNALHLNNENDDFILALEGECRRRLRLLPIRSIALIVCSDQLLSQRAETKALVKEAARVLELRWREVESPQLVRRLLPASARVSKPLLERMEDKVLEMLGKFSFRDVTGLTKSLANTSTRSLPILRAISYQLQEQRSQWETPAVMDIMSCMGNLGFHNPALFQEFAIHIQQTIDDCSPSLLCDVAKTYAVLRMPASELMDSIHRAVAGSLDTLSILDLKRLLFAYSQLNFKPPSASTFYNQVADILSGRGDKVLEVDRIDVVHSLALLQNVPQQILREVLQQGDQTAHLPTTQRLKLLQINSFAQLELPSHSGPFLAPDRRAYPTNQRIFHSTLHRSVLKVLTASLGDGFTVEENVRTEWGYVIDAEISSNIGGNGQNLAVITLGPPCYLYSTRQLIGRFEMMLRHLRLAGYQVIEIPYHDWFPLRSAPQQIQYLKDKLAQLLN